MRIYNPRNWFQILFQFHKYDTLRKLAPLILIISVYSAIVSALEFRLLDADSHPWLKNLNQFHNLLGFALSLLLVFRTNTAYDRWWEGRKQWGALTNNSRSLAIKLKVLLAEDDEENRSFFRRAIPLYAKVLKEHLQAETTRLALDEEDHPELRSIDRDKHLPNQVARTISERVMQLHRQGTITGEQLLFINPELISLTDICGACERIKNTPIPYSYSAFIKKFIFIYVMTLPFGYDYLLHYAVVPVVAVVFYVLASLELIAEEIEEPFGNDTSDLPMEKMAANIEKHVAELI